MLKPTTGRNSPISSQNFWNLAGRAGRLGQELEGNVYLIDYDEWNDQPMSGPPELEVTSALGETMRSPEKLLAFLDDEAIPSDQSPELEIVLGKLVLDQRNGTLPRTLRRYTRQENAEALDIVASKVTQISDAIDIPTDVLDRSMAVSVFRQRDLYAYFVQRLADEEPSAIIPRHPLADFKRVEESLQRAFKRIHTHLLAWPSKDRRQFYFAPFALRWMRSTPLPILIDNNLDYYKKKNVKKSVATVIRDTMEDIENELRFRYVKYFTCYNALLALALDRGGYAEYIEGIPNIPRFLEMGGSSQSMIELIGLGLSRTSAEALSEYITDKGMSGPSLREWLAKQDLDTMDISPICKREIQDFLKLVA
jgi:hypothetical protein